MSKGHVGKGLPVYVQCKSCKCGWDDDHRDTGTCPNKLSASGFGVDRRVKTRSCWGVCDLVMLVGGFAMGCFITAVALL